MFCEGYRPKKKKEEEEEEEEDGEMGILYNLSKIMKLVSFILIIDGTPKQHKMIPQKDFYQSLKGVLKHTLCVLIGILTKFSVDPYYEPLSQFMIEKAK